MLREHSHYLFRFHDEFVEAIASGIWFESADVAFDGHTIAPPHPLAGLAGVAVAERREASGIWYQIRRSEAPLDVLLASARYCSQPLMTIAAELDGEASVNWTLALRATNERPARTRLVRTFGGRPIEFDGVAGLEHVVPHVERWLAEVRARRDAMGKK